MPTDLLPNLPCVTTYGRREKGLVGRWGIIIPLAVMVFASSLFAAVGNLLLGIQMGFGHPMNYIIVSIYGGLALASALLVVWSVRGRRRWLISTATGP